MTAPSTSASRPLANTFTTKITKFTKISRNDAVFVFFVFFVCFVVQDVFQECFID
jgi:hypothetical protein